MQLFFFPDHVLVYAGNRVGAVSYSALEIDVSHTDFRETESVPADAVVIDHTWRYVNKRGGPDRRFKNNAEIPVCRYDAIALRSPTGLNIQLLSSRRGAGEPVREAEADLIPLRQANDVN